MARTPWTEVAAALTLPTLLVTGDQPDNTVDDASFDLLFALDNPAISVAVVEGSGHFVRFDDPQGYHTAVDPFLAEMLGQPVAQPMR